MEQILEKGRVIRGWLGIEAQDITPDLAESFGLREHRGAIVAGVYPDSAADRAGLLPGDIVTAVDDEPVDDARSAMNITAALAPGAKVKLAVIRHGSKLNLQATIEERPPSSSQQQ